MANCVKSTKINLSVYKLLLIIAPSIQAMLICNGCTTLLGQILNGGGGVMQFLLGKEKYLNRRVLCFNFWGDVVN